MSFTDLIELRLINTYPNANPNRAYWFKLPIFVRNIMFMRQGLFIIFIILATSCSSLKKLPPGEADAQKAYDACDYATTLSILEPILSKQFTASSGDTLKFFELAGHAALALGDTTKSEQYYKLAVYHQAASPRVYDFLAHLYKKQGNLSKEVMALEGLEQRHPESLEAKKSLPSLFDRYVETAQWEQAAEVWQGLDNNSKDQRLDQWFKVAMQLKKDATCDEAVEALLAKNPQHYEANMWKAKRLYDKGENRYQSEMETYEKNKTNAQYAKLLKGLEASTTDFKAALKLFESLYQLAPDPRTAGYISNIYARFGDEKNATTYRKLSSVNP